MALKEKRSTEERIIGGLREAGAGVKVADLWRKHGREATIYEWRAKYAGMTSRRPSASTQDEAIGKSF